MTIEVPSCVTVRVTPAMVSVPDRAEPLFAVTENVTVPLSTPEAADVTVLTASLLFAVHAQPVACDVIVTVPVPPLAPNDRPAVLRVNVQTTRRSARSSRVFAVIFAVCVSV